MRVTKYKMVIDEVKNLPEDIKMPDGIENLTPQADMLCELITLARNDKNLFHSELAELIEYAYLLH